jgi:hypothetical protein
MAMDADTIIARVDVTLRELVPRAASMTGAR